VLRFSLYSQLEVITAKMLSKYVPSGGARGATVLQLVRMLSVAGWGSV
jgi:hypothetical protein